MSYDPATEWTREDVIDAIVSSLSGRMWGERDWYAMAEQILQRIERQACGEVSEYEPIMPSGRAYDGTTSLGPGSS